LKDSEIMICFAWRLTSPWYNTYPLYFKYANHVSECVLIFQLDIRQICTDLLEFVKCVCKMGAYANKHCHLKYIFQDVYCGAQEIADIM